MHTKLNSFAFNGDLSELELQVGTKNNIFFFLLSIESNANSDGNIWSFFLLSIDLLVFKIMSVGR